LFNFNLLIVPGLVLASCAGDLGRAEAATDSASLDRPARTAKNSVFLEGGGAGVLYSVNYERHLGEATAIRVGYGFVQYEEFCIIFCEDLDIVSRHTIPILFSLTAGGRGPHNLNVSLGANLSLYRSTSRSGGFRDSVWTASPMTEVSYRLQPRSGGVYLRVGLVLMLLGTSDQTYLPLPWPTLALGATF